MTIARIGLVQCMRLVGKEWGLASKDYELVSL